MTYDFEKKIKKMHFLVDFCVKVCFNIRMLNVIDALNDKIENLVDSVNNAAENTVEKINNFFEKVVDFLG